MAGIKHLNPVQDFSGSTPNTVPQKPVGNHLFLWRITHFRVVGGEQGREGNFQNFLNFVRIPAVGRQLIEDGDERGDCISGEGLHGRQEAQHLGRRYIQVQFLPRFTQGRGQQGGILGLTGASGEGDLPGCRRRSSDRWINSTCGRLFREYRITSTAEDFSFSGWGASGTGYSVFNFSANKLRSIT